MIEITDIFVAINKKIRHIFPNAKVYKERIQDLDKAGLTVELIAYSTPIHSKNIINKSLDLDIIYFSENGKVFEALQAIDKLSSAFSMGLYVRNYGDDGEVVDKRFIHCLKAPEYKLVDDDLHFLVRFDFADELEASFLRDDNLTDMFEADYSKSYIANDKFKRIDEVFSDKKIDEFKNPRGDRKADNEDFALDVDFKTEKEKKEYKDEPIQLMERLSLDYEL